MKACTVLGIDPGFAALGLAAVNVTPGEERVERAWVIPEVVWPAPASIVERAADAISAVVAALNIDLLCMARRLAAPAREAR